MKTPSVWGADRIEDGGGNWGGPPRFGSLRLCCRERGVRPVKVKQRISGGCWRTLQGLADFAVVQSYLSTAAKWSIDAPDALTQLFIQGLWHQPPSGPVE